MAAEQRIEFDSDRANRYNQNIRKAIPGYEALHNMAYTLLEIEINLRESARLLIVGSGTGMELLSFRQRQPQWLLTGVEPAAEMMAIAKRDLTAQGLQDQVELHTGYVDTLPETQVMDAATLMLVMHFLPDDGSKLSLLQNIAKRLKPRATLILADLYGDKSLPSFQQLMSAWKSLYFSLLDDESRKKAEQDYQNSLDNSVYFVSEARIIELLETAGFSEITKFYNAFLFGGWIAKFNG